MAAALTVEQEQIIESLAQYDRKVKQLGLARKDNFLFTWIISVSIILPRLTVLILPSGIDDFTILTFFNKFGPLIMRLAYHLTALKYCIIVHLLYQRYNHLNEIVLPKDEWCFRGNMAVNRRSVIMRDLVYLHSTLTRATKILVKVYSFQLFVWVSSPIWKFLVALFYIQLKSVTGIWGFTEVPQIIIAFWLYWIFHTTTDEAKKFAMQILKTDSELIRAIDVHLQLDAAIYMYNHKILFRAWNLHDVNLPALFYATKEFIEAVNKFRAGRRAGPVCWSTAVKFLTARKFEVSRALALYDQHEATRRREGLALLHPTQEPLLSELRTGKFTVLPSRDATSAAIAIFTAHLHLPQNTTHQTTLQGVVYQLDAALESVETQRHGLVFIYDMSDSKYQNFDYDLSQKILTLLKGGYPAKLKKVLIVTAPLWFKAPFKILRLFVREKLRDRVFTVSIPQLTLHIPRESLPRRLGGTLEVQHEAWLLHCLKSMTNRSGGELCEVTPRVGSPLSPTSKSHTINQNPNDTSVSNPTSPVTAKHKTKNGVVNIGDIEITNGDIWIGSDEAPSPIQPPSSASSGFSDDDSLHGDLGLQAVSMEQLIEAIHSRGRAGLVADYVEIKQRPPDGLFNNAKLRPNQSKNRYTDVLCYDHTRVCLSQIDGDATSDYINANFVDGYKQKNAFISTQGPLPKTCGDFWRMIWEQQALVVVMTTRVIERGRTKCAQYWGPEPRDEVSAGNFTVTTLEVETNADYTISMLLLTNKKTEETREVCHMLYTAWPDYGVPQSAKALLQFLSLVRQQQNKLLANRGDTWAGHPRGPPVVVHCSAGIGRTGTFCTLDICISRLEDTGTVDIRGTVERIRAQRAHSIQMPDQYVFCHHALAEYALSRGMLSPQHLAMLPPTVEEDSD